ncbi:MAG TPA: hypothetical protein VFL91_07860 [Thermomicrobiales bacterium]|nr:hypothetical protein [Thermomicrobiales bacterium]
MADGGRERRNTRLRAALGAVGVALAGLLAALGLGRLVRRRAPAPTPAEQAAGARPRGLLRGYEVKDARAGCIIMVGVGMILIAIALHVGLWAMFDFFASGAQQRDLAPPPVFSTAPPSGPQLEVDPAADLARVRSREEALLDSYDWVDRQHGIVRIPIGRAMDLIVQQGLPGTPVGPATPARPAPPARPATPTGGRP